MVENNVMMQMVSQQMDVMLVLSRQDSFVIQLVIPQRALTFAATAPSMLLKDVTMEMLQTTTAVRAHVL